MNTANTATPIHTEADTQLHALAYNSVAKVEFSQPQLAELASSAASSNAELGVGGFLCYHNGCFFQYLEGTRAALEQLLATIEADPRHEITYKINIGSVEQRNFPTWSMRYLNQGDLQQRRLDNSVLDVLLHMMGPESAAQNPIGGVLNRIIEMRQQQATADLVKSNEELNRFAFIAAHDIGAPLRQMSEFARLLETEYGAALDDTGREFVECINTSATRLSTMVKDLLDYARLDDTQCKLAEVNLEQLVHDIVRDFKLELDSQGATIEVAHLPNVYADPGAIRQLMSNLIGNALKYRSDKTPQLRVYAEEKNSEWVISIEDNGIGIAREQLEDVFTMFKRCTGDARFSGTGIGLAICERVVNQLGGRIWVESELDQGSTFRFTVPHA